MWGDGQLRSFITLLHPVTNDFAKPDVLNSPWVRAQADGISLGVKPGG